MEIGPDAFLSCSKVANISLPKSLKVIGDYAFYGSRIVSVTIPENVEHIGEGAFKDCIWLKEIIYSATECNSVAKGEIGVFDNVGTSVDNGVNVKITKNVKNIPAFLFNAEPSSNAANIVEIIFEDNSECLTIGDQAFRNLRRVERFSFGANSKVKEIGNTAFGNVAWYVTSFTEFILPASVEKLDKYSLGMGKLNAPSTKIIFENAEGWYYTTSRANYNDKTGGTAITEADLLGKSPYAAFGGGNYLYRVEK